MPMPLSGASRVLLGEDGGDRSHAPVPLCECPDSSRAYEDWAVRERREPEGPSTSQREPEGPSSYQWLVGLVLGFTPGYLVSETEESEVS